MDCLNNLGALTALHFNGLQYIFIFILYILFISKCIFLLLFFYLLLLACELEGDGFTTLRQNTKLTKLAIHERSEYYTYGIHITNRMIIMLNI